MIHFAIVKKKQKINKIWREFFLRAYPENMIVVEQHCISKNFFKCKSHLLIKLQ